MKFEALEEKKDHAWGRRSLVSFTYLYLIPPVDLPRLETKDKPPLSLPARQYVLKNSRALSQTF